MRVYKFLSADFALQNVAKQRLKISEFTDMNDPYELNGVGLMDPDIESVLIPELQTFGVLCFSRNWKNPLLWSHYGDKHKGMCLGFDVNENALDYEDEVRVFVERNNDNKELSPNAFEVIEDTRGFGP